MKPSLKELVQDLTAEDRAELLTTLKGELNAAEIKQLENDLETVTALPNRVAINNRIQKLRRV